MQSLAKGVYKVTEHMFVCEKVYNSLYEFNEFNFSLYGNKFGNQFPIRNKKMSKRDKLWYNYFINLANL